MAAPARVQAQAGGEDEGGSGRTSSHVLVVDDAGLIRSAGRAVAGTMGWPPAVLLGRPVVELVHHADRRAFLLALADAGRSGFAALSHRMRSGDGRWIEVSTTASGLEDGGAGAAVVLASRLVGSGGEASVNAVAERYRTAVRTSSDALVVHVDGTIVAVSGPALAILGVHGEDELVGRNLVELVADESVEVVARRRDIVHSGGWPGTEHVTIARPDGTSVLAETWSSPVLWHRELASQITLRPLSPGDLAAPVGPGVATSGPGAAPAPEAAAGDEQIAAELRDAIAAEQIRVFFQPIVSLDDAEVLKVEALVRWEHPERGMVSPAEFVEPAERTGAIVELGAHVLDIACAQVAAWRRDEHPGLELSVNLSPRELADGGVVDRVRHALLRHGLPPHALWLEVTETAMSSDPKGALAVLRQLRDLGVRLAIDDFGTGFANLANLRQYPFGAVKIDRSFVAGLGIDTSDLVIVRSILKLAGELGLLVVAEGVETEAQRATLLEHGCELGQGYLFSRPTAPEDAHWLAGTDGRGLPDVAAATGRLDAAVDDLRLTRDEAEPLLNGVARGAAALLRSPAAFVVLDAGDASVEVVAGVGTEIGAGGPSALYRRVAASSSGSYTGFDDALAGLQRDPALGVAGARSFAAAAIEVDGSTVGLLCVADARQRRYGPPTIATLRALAQHAAVVVQLRRRTIELDRARGALAASEEQVHELEQRWQAVERSTRDLLGVVNVDGTIRSGSASSAAILGYDQREWTGRNALDLVHPDDLPTAVMSLTQTAATLGQARPIELRLRKADGSYDTFEVTSTTFETASGGHRVLMWVRDRMGNTSLLSELDWTRASTAAGFGLVDDIVVVCDEGGTVRALTPSARALHAGVERLSLSDWAGRLALLDLEGMPVPLDRQPLYRALRGEHVDERASLAGDDGGLRPVRVRAVPLRDRGGDGEGGGALIGAALAIQDLAPRRP